MIALLTPASLILGLIAWILPIVNIIKHKKANNRNWIAFSIISLSACIISIYFQILVNNHLVIIEDFITIMDTTSALVLASSVLIFVTIILNIISLFIYGNKRLHK